MTRRQLGHELPMSETPIEHPREDDRNDEVEGSPVPDPDQPNTDDEDTAGI